MRDMVGEGKEVEDIGNELITSVDLCQMSGSFPYNSGSSLYCVATTASRRSSGSARAAERTVGAQGKLKWGAYCVRGVWGHSPRKF